jgi:hypothetical protein
MKFTTVATAAALLVAASAHGGVGTYTIGTTAYQGYISLHITTMWTTLISLRWSPYNPAGTPKTIQRQYPSFDPLLIADLTVSLSPSSLLLPPY